MLDGIRKPFLRERRHENPESFHGTPCPQPEANLIRAAGSVLLWKHDSFWLSWRGPEVPVALLEGTEARNQDALLKGTEA